MIDRKLFFVVCFRQTVGPVTRKVVMLEVKSGNGNETILLKKRRIQVWEDVIGMLAALPPNGGEVSGQVLCLMRKTWESFPDESEVDEPERVVIVPPEVVEGKTDRERIICAGRSRLFPLSFLDAVSVLVVWQGDHPVYVPVGNNGSLCVLRMEWDDFYDRRHLRTKDEGDDLLSTIGMGIECPPVRWHWAFKIG